MSPDPWDDHDPPPWWFDPLPPELLDEAGEEYVRAPMTAPTKDKQ